ncbi:MAG: hypothetical protein QM602_00540 [Microbacterium sp.]
MSRRAVLWVAFAIVHIGIATLGFLLPNAPMGDVSNVYDPWSREVLDGRWVDDRLVRPWIVGIDEQWVYPQLALAPMVLAQSISWIAGYYVAWAIVVTAVDAVGFAVLVGRARSTGRVAAAWVWLTFLALLGPIAMYRVDAVTVPLAVMGGLWLVGRPWLGSALLAVATWIKVWPAALIAAAVVALRRRLAVVGAAVAVSALVALAVVTAGGARYLFGFVGDQAGRGLQIEAPVSAVYLWLAASGVPDAWVYYSPEMLTFQVTGPEVDTVIAVMTPLLVLVILAIAVLGAVKLWRGASFVALFPALSLAIVLAFIVVNKVGSPQYYVWLIAPLVIAIALDRARWWGITLLALGVAILTQVVYPILYRGLMIVPNPAVDAVLVLTVRNLCALVLFGWAIVKLARVRPHPHHHR